MTNWCDTCNGSGFTGWLWWAKSCADCDGKGIAKPTGSCGYIPMGLPSPKSTRNIQEALRIGREAKSRNDASRPVKSGSAKNDCGSGELNPDPPGTTGFRPREPGQSSYRRATIHQPMLLIIAALALGASAFVGGAA